MYHDLAMTGRKKTTKWVKNDSKAKLEVLVIFSTSISFHFTHKTVILLLYTGPLYI